MDPSMEPTNNIIHAHARPWQAQPLVAARAPPPALPSRANTAAAPGGAEEIFLERERENLQGVVQKDNYVEISCSSLSVPMRSLASSSCDVVVGKNDVKNYKKHTIHTP